MFFGMPSRIVNKQGKAIHGTLGFVGALNKIIALTKPTHIAVVFDSEHENARTEILPEYKANRVDYSEVPDSENPFSQLEDIYTALDFMNIKHFEADGLEADDVIASYAITYGTDMQIVISWFDSDFFQLINDNTCILRYRGDKTVICDEAYIENKYGILPDQYADFKSLTGDSADNIKGAERVGPKTAAALINQFGSLHDVLNNTNDISKPYIRESIIQSSARLANNYEIIKLSNNAALKFNINDLFRSDMNFTTMDILKGIGVYSQ